MSAGGATSSTTTVIPAPLAAFLDALRSEQLRWSLLRPRETLGSAQGDVDILVEPAQLGRVWGILSTLGFTGMPPRGRDLHAAIYDEASGRFVWIHVQCALQIAGAEIAAADVLAETSVEHPPQPQDDWLLWILLLRALVDKGELPGRHRPHVARLARSWNGGPPALESLARRHGLEPPQVVAPAAAGDWDGLMAHSVHRPAAAVTWRRRIGSLAEALRRLGADRGLCVAVLGPDGAGKTTLIEALHQSLPMTTRVQYMGLTGGLLPKADALRVPGLVFAARVAIIWQRYARAALHRARGRIVLFDRHTLDGAVPSGRRLGRVGRVSRRLQGRSCPLPDLVILLDASGATMHRRKGEYDPQVLESWRAAYGRLSARVARLQVVDAEQPPDAVRRQAEALIWRRYVEIRRAPRRRRPG